MKFVLSEKSFVILLFAIVIMAFSAAQSDSKKIEELYAESQLKNATYSTIIADNNQIKISKSNLLSN